MSDGLVHAAAGAMGGMVASAATYPLISLSTRAQVERRKAGGRESTLAAVQRVIANEGIGGLYDGLSSNLLGIAVTNAIFYGAMEETRAAIFRMKAKAGKSVGTLSTLESILASFVAGCATSIISNPLWVVNTKQTVQATLDDSARDGNVQTKVDPKTGQKTLVKKLGFWQTVKQLYGEEGILAFFRGLGPALILVINPIIAYTLAEQLKNAIIARRSSAAARLPTGRQTATSKPAVLPLTDLDNFLLGAVTKLTATGVTYPYLVVKSRMQAGATQGKKYKNAIHGLTTIIQEEGFSTLYRGIASKLVQSVLTAAFLFASKERFYQLAKQAIRNTAKAIPAQ